MQEVFRRKDYNIDNLGEKYKKKVSNFQQRSSARKLHRSNYDYDINKGVTTKMAKRLIDREALEEHLKTHHND